MQKAFKKTILAAALATLASQTIAGVSADSFFDNSGTASQGSVWIDSNGGASIAITSDNATTVDSGGATTITSGTDTTLSSGNNTLVNADNNVQIIVDNDDGGAGVFTVFDRNGPLVNGINTITSDAQSTTIQAGPAAGGVSSTMTVNSTGITLDSATNTLNGTTNNLTATTNNLNATTNNITGTNNTILGTTSINATGTANTTIGTAGNTTSLNSSINNIGVVTYGSTNNIGTGAGVSTNNIGNALDRTTVTAVAGHSRMALADMNASMTVNGMASGLAAATGNAGGGVVVSAAGGVSVDANGALSTNGATGPTAGIVMTNGYGKTHGVVITESQTTVSGGTNSSSMTLTDNMARFSNSATGAPITVTGVADGKNDFDAINVRQFASAISSTAAMANLPGIEPGKTASVGVGLGHFMDRTSLALGVNYRLTANSAFKLSAASTLKPNSGGRTVLGAGYAYSW